MQEKQFTEAGTNIAEVKRKNASSGLSYNEVLAALAQASKSKANEEFASEILNEKEIIDRTKK